MRKTMKSLLAWILLLAILAMPALAAGSKYKVKPLYSDQYIELSELVCKNCGEKNVYLYQAVEGPWYTVSYSFCDKNDPFCTDLEQEKQIDRLYECASCCMGLHKIETKTRTVHENW